MDENSHQSSDESDDDGSCTPPQIRHVDESVNTKLLPVESQKKYEAAYGNYEKWKSSNGIESTSESVMNSYFVELSEKFAPPTLWSIWSMLKSTISRNEGIDISRYDGLKDFLKRKSDGYKAKKSGVLSLEEIEQFLAEAPDNKYLATKVSLVFGIYGACRRDELANLRTKDVQHHGNIVTVKIFDKKTKLPRTFVINGEYLDIVKRYETLRPKTAPDDRFFLNFQNGKCTNQVIGINKFGSMPKQIAEYLNLPDPNLYTGHSFRRTSASLLSGSVIDSMIVKRHGATKNRTVVDGNAVFIKTEPEIESILSTPEDPSTSNPTDEPETPPFKKLKTVNVMRSSKNFADISDSTVNIDSRITNPVFEFHNCTVHIHYH